MTGNWQKSKGCHEELGLAKMLRKPIATYENGKALYMTNKFEGGVCRKPASNEKLSF
jgi:hypothetical protein